MLQLVPLSATPGHIVVPLLGRLVPAGFPSPADDYLEGEIDLSRTLLAYPLPLQPSPWPDLRTDFCTMSAMIQQPATVIHMLQELRDEREAATNAAGATESAKVEQLFWNPWPLTVRVRSEIPMRLMLLSAGLLACLSAPVLAQDVTCYDHTKFRAGQSAACAQHGGVLQPGQEGALPPDRGRSTNPIPDTATPTADTQTVPRSTRGQRQAQRTQQAPGGGPGQVWVNASSKAYHCPSDRYYGRTKRGSYMTETAAKAAGAHPSGGKACF